MTGTDLATSTFRPFLTASWHDLVMVSWAIEPALLRPYLAPGTELDLWQGDAVASIVAFDFRDTRVLGWRLPFHVRFPEVNLRFYVKRTMPDGSVRRGVTFIQEMVPRAAIAYVARTFYGEPYVATAMRRAAVPEQQLHDPDGTATRSLAYEWRRNGEWERVIALLTGPPRPMRANSTEEFIAEHYWGYTRRPGKPTLEYNVQHPRWNISLAAEVLIEADLATLYGPRFASALNDAPLSTFVAEGSAVSVSYGVPIAPTTRSLTSAH
jgi:uncharacterized protein YqjF (DUF2071 family)